MILYRTKDMWALYRTKNKNSIISFFSKGVFKLMATTDIIQYIIIIIMYYIKINLFRIPASNCSLTALSLNESLGSISMSSTWTQMQSHICNHFRVAMQK